MERTDTFEEPGRTHAAAPAASLPQRNWGFFLARGVLLLLLGIAALLAPGLALFAFALVFAAFSFADGIMAVISAIRGARHKRDRWGALLLSGLAGIAIGVLFVLFPLFSTFAYAMTIVILVAAWAVATGVFEIAAAIRLRKEIEGEWLLGTAGVLSVLLGLALAVLLVMQPGITALSVAWLIAIYALIAGVAFIVLALRLRRRSTSD